jgi:hypothetical protein
MLPWAASVSLYVLWGMEPSISWAMLGPMQKDLNMSWRGLCLLLLLGLPRPSHAVPPPTLSDLLAITRPNVRTIKVLTTLSCVVREPLSLNFRNPSCC